MKTWNIPVVWQEFGVVKVVADTLEEAMKLAQEDETIELPNNGYYIDESFELAYDDVEFIRESYNMNQEGD